MTMANSGMDEFCYKRARGISLNEWSLLELFFSLEGGREMKTESILFLIITLKQHQVAESCLLGQGFKLPLLTLSHTFSIR